MAKQASINIAQEFYVAYMISPGDPGGLHFWSEKMDISDDLTAIISEFGNSAQFTSIYGSMENDVLVNSLYQQLFSRDADPGGLAFYINRLETGAATIQDIAKQIIDGAVQDDATILANKVAVANCITDYVESEGIVYQVPDNLKWDSVLDSTGLDPVMCEDIDYNPPPKDVVVADNTDIDNSGVTPGEADLFA